MWVGAEGGVSEQLELEEAKLHSYPLPLTTETSARATHLYALLNPLALSNPHPMSVLPKTQAGSPSPNPMPRS